MKNNSFLTNDNVKLNYYDEGGGKPLIMIPGWSQSAAEFKYQISEFAKKYHVYAIDMRGHGESSKPSSGYNVSRLAKDVYDFIAYKQLDKVILLGHSMGCSVIWAFIELFGMGKIDKLVLVDQVPLCTDNPAFNYEERKAAGPIFDAKGLYDTANGITNPESSKAVVEALVGSMVTKAVSSEDLKWVLEENFKMPAEYKAELFINHCMNDWRRLIPTIAVPTLIIGGEVSIFSVDSLAWINKQIKGSVLEIFEENEGGSHFMFFENPTKFNSIVSNFLEN